MHYEVQYQVHGWEAGSSVTAWQTAETGRRRRTVRWKTARGARLFLNGREGRVIRVHDDGRREVVE